MIEHNYFYHTLSNWDTFIFTMNANIERNVVNVFTANDIEISTYVKRSPSNNVKFQTQIKYKIN